MQILAIGQLSEGIKSENIQPFLFEELKDTIKLYLEDIIRNFYFRSDKVGIVVMMECNSITEAEGHLKKLKLVKEDLLEFNLIPLKPLKPLEMFLEQ